MEGERRSWEQQMEGERRSREAADGAMTAYVGKSEVG